MAQKADGEVVWSWRLGAGVKPAEVTPPVTVSTSRSPGRSRISR